MSAAEALAAQSLVPELDERILALEQEREMRRAELARWISTDAERLLRLFQRIAIWVIRRSRCLRPCRSTRRWRR